MNEGGQRMNLSAMGSAGQGPNQATQSCPTPSLVIADRVSNAEDRLSAIDLAIGRLDMAMTKLIGIVHEHRNQLGLPPLPEDHFNA